MTVSSGDTVSPARVLFVASRPDIAGGEVYLLDVFRHLDPLRFVPIVAVPQAGRFSDCLVKLGIETLVLDVDYGWLRPPVQWSGFLVGFDQRVRRLVEFIRDHGIGLVHTNSNQVWEGAVAARLAGVHHVHVVHIPFQPDLPLYQRMPIDRATFARWVDELSSAIVAVAEPVAVSLCPPAAREKVEVIHNGVDLAAYRSARSAADGRIRQSLNIPADAPLITGIGRLHPDKGFDCFVAAAALVLQQAPDAYFLIAGAADSAEFERQLRQQIAACGLQGRVLLLGQRSDVAAILAESDVFLLTSLSEGGPYVLIEAVATGCACVASRCGGFVDQVIRDGEGGLLYAAHDHQAAAGHVLACLKDRALAARFVAAAQSVVFSGEFEVRTSVAKLGHLYQRVLSLPPPAAGSPTISLLMQMMQALGSLGQDVADLRERMKRTERAADLVLENPLSALWRRLRRGGGRHA